MKNLIQLAFCLLLIFSTVTLQGQIVEQNWTTGNVNPYEIKLAPDKSGYFVNTYGSIQKWDAVGNIIWEYQASNSFPDFRASSILNFEIISSDSIFISIFGWECDISPGSGVAMIDGTGNELWAKTLGPLYTSSNYIELTAINPQKEIIGLGHNFVWKFGGDGTIVDSIPISSELRKGWQSPLNLWYSDDQLLFAKGNRLYHISEEGDVLDSIIYNQKIIAGIPQNDSLTFIILESRVESIKAFKETGLVYGAPNSYRFLGGILKNDRIFLYGNQSDKKLIGSISTNLGDPNFTTWGNDFLTQNGIASIDSSLIVIGTEKASTSSRTLGQLTGFLKTFSNSDFENVTHDIDMSIESIEWEDAYGRLDSVFYMDMVFLYVRSSAFVRDVSIRIRNNGSTVVDAVTWNRVVVGASSNCGDPRVVRSYTIDSLKLNPNRDTTISVGNYIPFISAFGSSTVPTNVTICYWLSSPDEKLDVNNENDVKCASVSLRDATSTNEILSQSLIALYPNPTSEVLNIELENPSFLEKKIEIHNMAGQSIFQKNWESNTQKQQIEVGNFPTGVYFLSVKTEEGVIVKKWVKAE